jgi:arylsulfatase A-like enzyme
VVLYDEGIRIPLIMSIPGYTSGTVFIKKPVLTSDLVVTLAELYDLNYPYYHSTQGYNLFDLPPVRIRICQGLPYFKKFSIFMVEQHPFKLVSRTPLSLQTMSLYNLRSDPYEKNPLTNASLKKEYFLNLSKNFLRKKKMFNIAVSRPNLTKKELDNLRSLGYMN